jgi:recombination endonuclease VII
MKTCAGCHLSLPATDFTKDRRHADGLDSYCRPCKAKKQKQIPREKMQEYQNRWRAKNGDRVRQKGRERYAANPERAKGAQQRYQAKHRTVIAERRRVVTLRQYGITPAEYDARLAAQDGRCAICRSEDPQHWSGRFQVDHDHATGLIRGLLCAPCNGGIGLLGDTPTCLQAAINYLS